MTPPKKIVPDVHFPRRPLVADKTPLKIRQKQLTMFETMIFGEAVVYCVMTGEGGEREELGRLCWVRSAPSLSRDTGAAFPN